MRYDDASHTGSTGHETVAHPDVDTLPPGSYGPATGNAITGAGTTSGSSGADSVGAAPATIIAVQGAGGAAGSANGEFQATGQYGVLSMDAQGNFSYVRNPGTPDGVQDVFNYTLADAKGANSSSTLTFGIGPNAQTQAEAQAAAALAQQGIVNLPAGVEMSDIHVNGRDLVINMPDGTQMVIPGGAVFVPQLTIGDVQVPPTNLAALLIDSEPQPAAGPPQSSGGNFADPVPPLDPGVPLGDLIPPTELSYTPPEVKEVNQFEDTQPTIIIETPDFPAGAVNASESVNEKGLPAPRDGDVSNESVGSGEGADGNGLNNSDGSETNTGTIVFTAEDGLDSITIDGAGDPVQINAGSVGTQIQGAHGILTITGVNLANGTITYSYTLTDNTSGDATSDLFTIVVTDHDGDTATGTLTVNIIDDVPTARNDTDSIDLQSHVATGNVITAEGTTSAPGGADTLGADNATLTAVSSNGTGQSDATFDASGNLVVEGSFGTLTIKADGSYTYTAHSDSPGGSNDVFTYTLTDGDGDTSQATLTINNPDHQPTVGTNELVQLDDDALAGGNPGGVGDDPNAVNTSGQLSGSGGDGTLTFSLTAGGTAPAGFSYQLQSDGSLWVLQDQNGTQVHVLTITTTAGGDYTVTQVAVIDHPAGNNENNVDFDVTYTVTDADGDSVTGHLPISVDDDTPIALNDTDAVDLQTGLATGNVITAVGTTNNGPDSAGADGDGHITGLSSNNVSGHVDNDATGGFVVVGQFGTLTMQADGSYSYAAKDGAPGGSSDVFTYSFTDGDGDTTTATLTITNPDHTPTINIQPDDKPASINAEQQVDEKGLPAPREGHSGETAGSGEIADGIGDNNSDPSESGGGVIHFQSQDGVGSIKINGTTVNLNPSSNQVIQGAHGILTITGVNLATGEIQYTYTLTENTSGDNTHDDFSVTITDSDGDTATANLRVDIVDDVPTANPDTNSVNEGGTATGNVETNDIPGADNFAAGGGVTGVEAGSHPGDVVTGGVGDEITGTYGKLTLNADGSYTYHADPNTNPPSGATDVFTYTITDGDGDTSTTTLTIDVNDVTLNPDNQIKTVNEAALDTTTTGDDLGHGSVTGSNPSSTAETVTGALAVSGATGYTAQSVTTAHGIFQLNADGTYTYTLTSPFTGSGGNDGTVADGQEVFTYTAHDADGNTVTGTITINVLDDVPTAQADTNSVNEGGLLTVNAASGVESNDVFGADGKAAGGGVTGVEAGSHPGDVVTGGVGDPIVGTYGTLTLNADGSYTYQATPNSNPPSGATDVFTYTITDGDGDKSTTTLTINVNDVTLNPDNQTKTVNEAALDTTTTGSDLGHGTVTGSNPGSSAETVTGALAVSGATGYTAQSVTTTHGIFQLNADGTYTYTLTNPVTEPTANNGTDTVNGVEVFTYTAHDADGNTVTGTITINVTDDVPTAHADTNSVSEGGTLNVNAASGVESNDVFGADGKSGGGVTGVEAGNHPTDVVTTGVGSPIAGTYGTLTLNADGSYTYHATANSNPPAGATDVFTYTITDGDGDTSTTTLTISVNDVTLNPDDQTKTVNEAALDLNKDGNDLAAGTVTGSNPGSTAETVQGQLNVSGATGYTAETLSGTHGTLHVNADGSYVYTLTSPVTEPTANNGADTVNNVESFTYTAHDADGNTVTGTITINVVDDVPTAAVSTAGFSISHDETPGLDGDANDVAGPLTVFASVSNPGEDPDVPPLSGPIGYAVSTGAISSTGTVFGADGPAASGSVVFSLNVSNPLGVDSGLNTTDGTNIFLFKEGDLIVGRVGATAGTASSGVAAFAIAIDSSTGQVSMVQYLSIEHGNTGSLDESASIANGAILAVVTATDGDGDKSTASTGIGSLISFQDDGPSAVHAAAISSVTMGGGDHSASANLDGGAGGNSIVSDNFGADGPGKVIFNAASISGLQGQHLEHGGVELTYVISNGGQTIDGFVDADHSGTITAGDTAVFTIDLQTNGGNDYTVTMHNTIDSTQTINFTDTNFDFIGGNKAWFGIVPNGQVSTPVDDNSHDVLITPTNNTSINTSGILGGVDTGQSVGPGEGFRIDYVVDLTGSPPNDYTQNAANSQVFDDHWTTNDATFTMRQSTGSNIKVSAWTDPDGDDIVHTGDTQQAIDGLTISYNGASSGNLIPTSSLQNVTVGGVTFSYQLDADGKSVLINNVQGNTGANETPATLISIHTANGYEELQVDNVGGDTFKFSGFGAVDTTTAPVDFTVPISIVDGDGDTVSSGNLAIHAAPVSNNAPINNAATTMSVSSTLSTSSLVASNDNSGSQHTQETHRALSAGQNTAVMAALAAAGLEAEHSGVEFRSFSEATGHAPSLSPLHSSTAMASALQTTHASGTTTVAHEALVAKTADAAHSGGHAHQVSTFAHGVDHAGANHGQAMTELLHASTASGHGSSANASAVTAPAVAMPSAQQLQAAAAQGGAQQPAAAAQHDEVVGKVLADSLHGGEGHGPNIDALLSSLPGHAHGGGNEALAALAIHAAASVPFGHMGFGGAFGGHGMPAMELMHQDAAPVTHG